LIEDRHRAYPDGVSELQRAALGRIVPDDLCDGVIDAMVLDENDHDDDIALVALALKPAHD
jgi:hypothetical protein